MFRLREKGGVLGAGDKCRASANAEHAHRHGSGSGAKWTATFGGNC